MNLYFIEKNGIQFGPYTIVELAKEKISQNTLVWSEGFSDWKPAVEVEELNGIIIYMPPALPIHLRNKQKEILNAKRKKIKLGSIKIDLIFSIIISTILTLILTKWAISQNAVNFGVYLTDKQISEPVNLFFKFYPYALLCVVILKLFYRFLSNKNLVNKITSTYTLELVDIEYFENFGDINVFKVDFIPNQEGIFYQQISSKKFFFDRESMEMYTSLDNCLDNYFFKLSNDSQTSETDFILNHSTCPACGFKNIDGLSACPNCELSLK